jgi:hypothetical protein
MDEQIPGPAGKGVANCKGRGMYVCTVPELSTNGRDGDPIDVEDDGDEGS